MHVQGPHKPAAGVDPHVVAAGEACPGRSPRRRSTRVRRAAPSDRCRRTGRCREANGLNEAVGGLRVNTAPMPGAYGDDGRAGCDRGGGVPPCVGGAERRVELDRERRAVGAREMGPHLGRAPPRPILGLDRRVAHGVREEEAAARHDRDRDRQRQRGHHPLGRALAGRQPSAHGATRRTRCLVLVKVHVGPCFCTSLGPLPAPQLACLGQTNLGGPRVQDRRGDRYPLGMNLQQLRYLVATADTGTMTAAAAQLHVAQPALSRAMKALGSESRCRSSSLRAGRCA